MKYHLRRWGASNFADVHRFTTFAHDFVDLVEVPDDLLPRTCC